MKRDLKIFIEDILISIKDIDIFLAEINKEAFLLDRLRQKAVLMCLETIGEAVKNIPDDFRQKYPKIEWKKIAGTRDNIIHRYFDTNLDLTWDIIKNDLPVLKKQIQQIKKDLENNEEIKEDLEKNGGIKE